MHPSQKYSLTQHMPARRHVSVPFFFFVKIQHLSCGGVLNAPRAYFVVLIPRPTHSWCFGSFHFISPRCCDNPGYEESRGEKITVLTPVCTRCILTTTDPSVHLDLSLYSPEENVPRPHRHFCSGSCQIETKTGVALQPSPRLKSSKYYHILWVHVMFFLSTFEIFTAMGKRGSIPWLHRGKTQ